MGTFGPDDEGAALGDISARGLGPGCIGGDAVFGDSALAGTLVSVGAPGGAIVGAGCLVGGVAGVFDVVVARAFLVAPGLFDKVVTGDICGGMVGGFALDDAATGAEVRFRVASASSCAASCAADIFFLFPTSLGRRIGGG